MKLGQLSRRIGISIHEIVLFLRTQRVFVKEDSNTPIEDEHIHQVMQHFSAHLLESTPAAPTPENSAIELSSEKTTVTNSINTREEEHITTSDLPLSVEVIKAPKIELSGLKVLGKIDLPEKGKKVNERKAPHKIVPETKNNKRLRPLDGRTYKNPVSLKREREVQEFEKKRKEKIAQQKEQKTHHYMSSVKVQKAVKKTTKKNTPPLNGIEKKQLPTTWLGKFIRWLNS